MLLAGMTNQQIYVAVGQDTPEVFPDDHVRQYLSGSTKNIPYNALAEGDLWKLIKTLRKEADASAKRQESRDRILKSGGTPSMNMAEVPFSPEPYRLSTGFDDIDNLFGHTTHYDQHDNIIGHSKGLMLGKLLLLGGEEGVGKTRFYTSLAITLAVRFNKKIGVFQGEMTESDYCRMIRNICRAYHTDPDLALANIWMSRSEHHYDHCQMIQEHKLDLFVWDSFPMLANSRSKEGVDDIVLDIKSATQDQCAGILVAHLNEKGQIKDNSHIRYMGDGSLYMYVASELGEDVFVIVTGKNRQGKRGMKAFGRHNGQALEVLNASVYQPLEEQLGLVKKKQK